MEEEVAQTTSSISHRHARLSRAHRGVERGIVRLRRGVSRWNVGGLILCLPMWSRYILSKDVMYGKRRRKTHEEGMS
ncbi:hypothetical protein CPB83DRAFT_855660 [Crepidotus variabilis]|uniref:Uncharacterized protein n=1 Tax=Crepidotus variabilis TaxID=179855 RepID=A0A9P6EF46_9AGAR|nr:hypothetical protein CPB83DRAFT_855660 [Crepidotus variabilis]